MTVELEKRLRISGRVERTAAIAAWFQGLYDDDAAVPVFVGGGAVELFTGGAYTTGDFDFVGSVPGPVARKLAAAGFRHEGRHWIHREGRVFIEFPSSQLDPQERVVSILSSGWIVRTISPEDLIVDRLASWQFWQSSIDAVNAYLLFRRQRRRLDLKRLRILAATKDVVAAHKKLLTFVARLGARPTGKKELERWANNFPS